MSNRRGNFTLKFPNNKKIKFRTREAYSNAFEVMSRGRFTNAGQMYERVKRMSTGFELGDTPSKKVRDFEKRFNGMEFDE